MEYLLCIFIFSGWGLQTSGVSVDLYDIDCLSPTEAWIVGASGTILHTADAGVNWDEQSSGTDEDLYGIDFIDALNGWAVGSGPTILATTDGGSSWNAQTPNTQNDLLDVAFVNMNRGWTTGLTGTIMGTSDGGASWDSEISGQWGWFWGITAASPDDAWVIGADWFNHISPVYHYDGSWTQQFAITTTENGKAISAANSSVVWAVGGNGTIYNTTNSGNNWNSQTSGVSSTLCSISAVSSMSCWTTGASGTILYTDNGGNEWLPQESPISDSLYGIGMFDTLCGWIVGENGSILYTSDGGTGTEEICDQTLTSRFSAFPNPTASDIYLLLPPSIQSHITISLFDITGRSRTMLYSGVPQSTFTFSLTDHPAGAYFLVVSTSDMRMSRQIIKTD